MVHETFKAIGYEKLFKYQYGWKENPIVNQYGYINNSFE
jgi:hypothetical protein